MADDINQASSFTSNFRVIERPVSHSPFRNLPGWEFDNGLWATPSLDNNWIKLPLAQYIDLDRIPESFFKSGVLSPEALDFIDIRVDSEFFTADWTPGVGVGPYTTYDTPMFLHSSESYAIPVRTDIDLSSIELDANGITDPNSKRSIVELEQTPAFNTPISVSYFQRDINLGIKPLDPFTLVPRFTGIAIAGIEQDGNYFKATNTALNEFMLSPNEDEPIEGLELIEGVNLSSAGSIVTVAIPSPVSTWAVKFSRPDIFKNEIDFEEWMNRSSGDGDALSNGDYAIGYKGSSGASRGVVLWMAGETHASYGTISYKPNNPSVITFNKNVVRTMAEMFSDSSVELTNVVESDYGATYYLPIFPVLDLSLFEDGGRVGALALDRDSFSLRVGDTEWSRVEDISAVEEGDDQLVYELDPLWGTVTFGNNGNRGVWGKRPADIVRAAWSAVPLIRFDTEQTAASLFYDPTENLDPLLNGIKHGFLVLDSLRRIPGKITLSAECPSQLFDDTLLYGKTVGPEFEGLEIPATKQSDVITLKARVTARGNPTEGVPNIPVRFVCKDNLLSLSRPFGITDGDGCVYTQALGQSNFQRFTKKIDFYRPTSSVVLNPNPNTLDLAFSPIDPLIKSVESPAGPWADSTPEWENNAILVTDLIIADPSDIYLFVGSISGAESRDDYDGDTLDPELDLSPYNSKTRLGGISIVWSVEEDGAQKIVHPIEIVQQTPNQALLIFDRTLPLPIWVDPDHPAEGLRRRLIMNYRIISDRVSRIVAETTEAPLLTSNEVSVLLSLNSTMKGQWKLPVLSSPYSDGFQEEPEEENTDSSRISTGVFLSPNDIHVTGLRAVDDSDIDTADPGQDIKIRGTNFPTTAELKPAVFLVKLDSEQKVSAVKNITSSTTVIDSETILVDALPSGLSGAGQYYLAVANYTEYTSALINITG